MSGTPSWRKSTARAGEAAREAAGLRWLASSPGGARIARVLDVGDRHLSLERVVTARPTVGSARAFGAALARTHAAGAASLGCPPPGAAGHGMLGLATLWTPDEPPSPSSWGAFYAEHRVLPHLRAAVDRRSIDASGARTIEACARRLADGGLDHPQPAAVAALATPIARLHGDLWSGNVLWSDRGDAVLIDPAAHGGHAETDLAMLSLFGLPFLDAVIEGYQQDSPLADGWRGRIALHHLHPLLVHAELFGGGYGAQAVRAAARYR